LEEVASIKLLHIYNKRGNDHLIFFISYQVVHESNICDMNIYDIYIYMYINFLLHTVIVKSIIDFISRKIKV